jgi:hypothetical protein
MDILYIIGNGFDMYHGLNTSYQSFGLYLKENHSDIYDNLIEYYYLPDLDSDDDEKYYEWACFEMALADLDYSRILDDNSDWLPNIASDDFRDRDWHSLQVVMEELVKDLTTNLLSAFKEFIIKVEFPDINPSDLLSIDSNAIYLSFNYTNTLEKYYNINPRNIFYIHNKALSNDALILGHGTDPINFDDNEDIPPEGLTEEEMYEWKENIADNYNYSYESGKQELMAYFTKTFKFTTDIINQNVLFFQKLKHIKKVFVLGQSVSEVDQPYFKKIIESIEDKTVNWDASYHGDKQPICDNMIAIGLNDEQINLFKMDEIKVKNDINYTLF